MKLKMRSRAKESAPDATSPASLNGGTSFRPPRKVTSSGGTVEEDVIMGGTQHGRSETQDTSPTINGEYLNNSSSTDSNNTESSAATQTLDGLDLLGSGVKVLLHAINDLARHGIDTTVPLPKIVVVGNQSAGKSSLIEAISEIKVPRDVGTCTRCPLQITITSDESDNPSWFCNVSLSKRFDYYHPNQLEYQDSKSMPFYPWVPRDAPLTIPFTTVRDKNDLERVIKAAQVATLNPGVDPKLYASLTDVVPGATTVEFSPNLICLEIAGPDLPNLTFYDLPGVIAQTQTTERHPVKLVKNLVRQYIQEKNTLILLATPMDSEIENATASSIVNKAGALDRCIGVLTKPDRLPGSDRINHWNSILRGEAFRLGHGYFATKQPSQDDLDSGVSHKEARLAESTFFSSPSWSTKFPGHEDRLGTGKLQRFLSVLLAKLILECLPEIRSRVTMKLANIESRLGQIPDPPENALNVVTNAVAAFNSRLQQRLEGGFANDLFKNWNAIKKDFREAITDLRPALLVRSDLPANSTSSASSSPQKGVKQTPSKTPSVTPSRANESVISIVSDDEDPVMETPSKKRKAPGPTSIPIRQTPVSSRTEASNNRLKLNKKFTLQEIRSQLDDYSASGLPGGIDPKAVDQMILATLTNWAVPMNQLFNRVENELLSALKKTLDECVSRWRTTDLYRQLSALSSEFLSDQMKRQRQIHAPRTLHLETRKPFTENSDALDLYRSREFDILHTARFKARANNYFDEQDAMTGKRTSAEDRTRKMQGDKELRNKIGTDPYQREIGVMANIRGYYTVAASRFVDNICQSVESDLFDRFRDSLRDELEEGLGIRGANCECKFPAFGLVTNC